MQVGQRDWPWRSEILMLPGLLLSAGDVQGSAGSGRNFFFFLEFIEKTAALFYFPPSFSPAPPILLFVAGYNYAVNFGRGKHVNTF